MPVTGRYAVQGAQVRVGLELWARRAGASIVLEDDASRPERAARLHAELLGRGCRFVLGPYGSDCTRAVAAERRGAVVWNHGAAADDVQRMPGVVSVPSPASRYLVALGRAVAALRPGATVALVTAAGAFARFAREGLERAARSLDLDLVARFSFSDPPAKIAATRCDAILACGPLKREIELFRSLAARCRADRRALSGAGRRRSPPSRASAANDHLFRRLRARPGERSPARPPALGHTLAGRPSRASAGGRGLSGSAGHQAPATRLNNLVGNYT